MVPTSKTVATYTDRMMGRKVTTGRWRSIPACMTVLAATLVTAACNRSGADNAATTSAEPPPITIEVNQSRDQYGKQAVLIQLTNTTDAELTVTGARLTSPLFNGDISWEQTEALKLPPRQPKSLPARLPAPACHASTDAAEGPSATVRFSEPGKESTEATTGADDPFGVLARNSGELCLSADVAAVATMALDPTLEVAPDARTAVVRLVISPSPTGATTAGFSVESIDQTTLLAETPTDPWPRDIEVASGGSGRELALRIRPARCDPHAVAEDKVGTLLPLRIKMGERQGLVKIPAPNQLRGLIYDFVTAACAKQ
ncbi:hypothetical protein SAMN04487917_104162 [Arthrobacter sp. yr096]|nr:hypothetical protein SAMN04487917_104162 [Arthrobacter sp. yr096]